MANPSQVPRHRTPAWAFLVGAVILGLGLAGAGFLIGRGFERGRSADRYVTVKGLAESLVTADLAVWPLRITATGGDLARVQEQIDRDLATVAQTSIVRSEQGDRIARLNQQTGEIVKRGVVLADTGGPTYLFTRLNEIKPELLAEATRNARLSAEQFAADSGSSIAEIRRASQGLFEILPRDPAPGLMEANQVDKKIRVVSTIEYRLVD